MITIESDKICKLKHDIYSRKQRIIIDKLEKIIKKNDLPK